MGQVLSQGEIDALLKNMLSDSSVLPSGGDSDNSDNSDKGIMFSDDISVSSQPQPADEFAGLTGIELFKAKMAAKKAEIDARAAQTINPGGEG